MKPANTKWLLCLSPAIIRARFTDPAFPTSWDRIGTGLWLTHVSLGIGLGIFDRTAKSINKGAR